jgi:hypothetical protein
MGVWCGNVEGANSSDLKVSSLLLSDLAHRRQVLRLLAVFALSSYSSCGPQSPVPPLPLNHEYAADFVKLVASRNREKKAFSAGADAQMTARLASIPVNSHID